MSDSDSISIDEHLLVNVESSKRWYQSRRAKLAMGFVAAICICAGVALSVLGAQGSLPSSDSSGDSSTGLPSRPSFKSLAVVMNMPAPVVTGGSAPGMIRSQLNFTHVNGLNQTTHLHYDVEHHESVISPGRDMQVMQITCNATHITVYFNSTDAVANKSSTWTAGTLIAIQSGWACGQTIRRLAEPWTVQAQKLRIIYPTTNASLQDVFKSANISFSSNFTEPNPSGGIPVSRFHNKTNTYNNSNNTNSNINSSNGTTAAGGQQHRRRRGAIASFFDNVIDDAVTVASDIVDAADAIVEGTFAYDSGNVQHTWASPEYSGSLGGLSYSAGLNATLTTGFKVNIDDFTLQYLDLHVAMTGMASFAASVDQDFESEWVSDTKSVVEQTRLCTFVLPIGGVDVPVEVYVSANGGVGFSTNGSVNGSLSAYASVFAEGGVTVNSSSSSSSSSPTSSASTQSADQSAGQSAQFSSDDLDLVTWSNQGFNYTATTAMSGEATLQATVVIIPQVFFKIAFIGGPQVLVPLELFSEVDVVASLEASAAASDDYSSQTATATGSASVCAMVGAGVQVNVGASVDVDIGSHNLFNKSTSPLTLWSSEWWFYQYPDSCAWATSTQPSR